jgi:hypothetical protein
MRSLIANRMHADQIREFFRVSPQQRVTGTLHHNSLRAGYAKHERIELLVSE